MPTAQTGLMMNTLDGTGSSMASDATQLSGLSRNPSTRIEDAESAKENLEDYETQLFGFTPKSFVSGSKFLLVFTEHMALERPHTSTITKRMYLWWSLCTLHLYAC